MSDQFKLKLIALQKLSRILDYNRIVYYIKNRKIKKVN